MRASANGLGASAIEIAGSFNPLILSPDWLVGKGAIDEVDREYAVEEDEDRLVLTPEFAGVRLNWAVLEVTREDMAVHTTPETETPERLREFVVRVLEALPETPIFGLSVLHGRHASIGGDAWSAICDQIAPKPAWVPEDTGDELKVLERRSGNETAYSSILLEPSEVEGFDAYVGVQRGWQVQGEAEIAIERLDAEWEALLREANRIFESALRPA